MTTQLLDEQATVFVIDDDEPVRDSLRLLLQSLGKNVEAYSSAQAFLDHFNRQRSGCLVLDIRMPGMTGIELQEVLNKQGINLPIIFITGHGEVPIAVTAMRNGAFDFIQKPFTDHDLLTRVDAALELNEQNQIQHKRQHEFEKCFNTLSHREKEVMTLITEGKSNKYIAVELGLSQRTVEAHRAHIMDKMQTKSLPHLVRMAMVLRKSKLVMG